VDIKLGELAAPIVDREPLPHRTTKILHQMPTAFAGMGALMGGIYWIIKRRQQNMTAGGSGSTGELGEQHDGSAGEHEEQNNKKPKTKAGE
jgi:hypothetical protein